MHRLKFWVFLPIALIFGCSDQLFQSNPSVAKPSPAVVKQTSPTLLAKASWASLCYSARAAINAVCFNGGNSGHKDAARDAQNSAANCLKYAWNKRCVGIPRRKIPKAK